MTDPISIPLENHYHPPHPFKHPHIDITPEIQAQILAPVMERIANCEQRGDMIIDRIAALERRSGMSVLQRAAVAAPAAADKPAPSLATWASGHCPTCHQHKDVMGMPCNDPWHVEQVCAIGRADQPAGDDAALTMQNIHADAEDGPDGYGKMRAVVAASRRGEVPGIYGSGMVEGLVNELNATVADLRAKLADAETHGKDMEAMWDQNRHALAARVAELERELKEWDDAELSTEEHNAIDAANAERDKALADLAASQESERRFRAEVEAGFRKHGFAAGPECIDRLVEDLAASREETKLERGINFGLKADLAAMTAERDYFISTANHNAKMAQDVAADLKAARAEADALRAAGLREQEAAILAKTERDALKARKVTLPQEYNERGGSHETKAEAYGYNKALSDCADAIRAAGVEVVS